MVKLCGCWMVQWQMHVWKIKCCRIHQRQGFVGQMEGFYGVCSGSGFTTPGRMDGWMEFAANSPGSILLRGRGECLQGNKLIYRISNLNWDEKYFPDRLCRIMRLRRCLVGMAQSTRCSSGVWMSECQMYGEVLWVVDKTRKSAIELQSIFNFLASEVRSSNVFFLLAEQQSNKHPDMQLTLL